MRKFCLNPVTDRVDPQRFGFDDRKMLECKGALKDREMVFCLLGPPDQEALSCGLTAGKLVEAWLIKHRLVDHIVTPASTLLVGSENQNYSLEGSGIF